MVASPAVMAGAPPRPDASACRHSRIAKMHETPLTQRLLPTNEARVLVVGDVILDRYWHGSARRISPEAPVPVVTIRDTVEGVGGAANVAANVAALGARVRLCGVVGADVDGDKLGELCAQQGIAASFVRPSGRRTIVKLRVVSQHQQLIRLDFESLDHADDSAAVMETAAGLVDTCDVIVISDYAKGAVVRPAALLEAARAAGKPVIVDPKGVDFGRYTGAAVLTPNLLEFEAVVGTCRNDGELVERARRLIERHRLGALLITRGEAGMTLVDSDGSVLHVPARAQDVFDVTGAGDTVCGVLATALAAGNPLSAAVELANAAAGLVVGKFGAATINARELDAALAPALSRGCGVVSHSELIEECANARRRGERIVMTNGCFDILHAGHVRCLIDAKAHGDRLIVAVNDDASVAALKGPARPLNPLASRMAVLAALDAVDWVVPFTTPTPRDLIAEVLPDVLVKGGDYRPQDIAGGAEVLAAGGQVVCLDYHAGHSTSQLIASIATVADSS